MFEYLYEWIRNIAFYMILVTVLLEALPENSYKKYIRFFTGMILVLLLATPILKLCGMQTIEYPETVKLEDYREEVEEKKCELEHRLESMDKETDVREE